MPEIIVSIDRAGASEVLGAITRSTGQSAPVFRQLQNLAAVADRAFTNDRLFLTSEQVARLATIVGDEAPGEEQNRALAVLNSTA